MDSVVFRVTLVSVALTAPSMRRSQLGRGFVSETLYSNVTRDCVLAVLFAGDTAYTTGGMESVVNTNELSAGVTWPARSVAVTRQ